MPYIFDYFVMTFIRIYDIIKSSDTQSGSFLCQNQIGYLQLLNTMGETELLLFSACALHVGLMCNPRRA